jgi:hypothetical protein
MAPTSRGPRQGTGFINWGDMVAANRGGANRTSKALMDPTEAALGIAEGELDIGTKELNREIGAATLDPYNPNTTTDAEADLYSGATYGGPNAATDNVQFEAGLGRAQRADVAAKRAADMYSRIGTLKDAFGKGNPGYSPGMQRLDSALLETTNGQAFRDQSKAAGGLLDKFSASGKAVGESIASAKQKTADAATGYQNAVRYRNTPGAPVGTPIQTPGTMPDAPPVGAPYVTNAKKIEEENARKARYGYRG